MASGQHWEVVGGADKGGIIVRAGQATTSEQLQERLATGALVLELALVGDRLQYRKVSGEGPETGWVSISLKDKTLLARAAAPVSEVGAPKSAAGENVSAAAGATDSAAPASAPAVASSTEDTWTVKEGDYYVTLGIVYKKAGGDPTAGKILSLNRKVGAIVHTTGKIWKGPSGGIWVELDVAGGDSGAGEKPGYVMIDGPGFGTPGPCLQKAYAEDGPPVLLRAPTPADAKPWDGNAASEKELVAFQKTTAEELRTVVSMLFALGGPSAVSFPSGNPLADPAATVRDVGLKSGEVLRFEVKAAQSMSLVVMSPLEEGVKLLDLQIKDDWTVAQVKALLCDSTGLKRASTMMARGKMGQRVSEDATLPEKSLVAECGYKDGDEIAFIYLGDPAADLEAFLAKK